MGNLERHIVKRQRLDPVENGFYVMEERPDGTWKRIDFCENLIDAQRQYPKAKVKPAPPVGPSRSKP